MSMTAEQTATRPVTKAEISYKLWQARFTEGTYDPNSFKIGFLISTDEAGALRVTFEPELFVRCREERRAHQLHRMRAALLKRGIQCDYRKDLDFHGLVNLQRI
jgi:hypothetical protein